MGFISGTLKLLALLVLLVSIFIGSLMSGHLGKLGFFQYLAKKKPNYIGICPLALTDEERATAFKFEDMADLTGKVSLVTGANVGLGYWTAYHLAHKGSKVVVACRSEKKCNAAVASMKEMDANVDVEPMLVDLGSLQSVQDFAQAFSAKFERLDIAVLNAGFINVGELELTADGIETTFAVNHLGHFKLFKDLRPLIENTAENSDVSVVHVSSSAHYRAPEGVGVHTNLAGINNATDFSPMTWYGQSKLANVLFSNEIAAQMAGKRVFSNAAHPGGVATNFGEGIKKAIKSSFSGIPLKIIMHIVNTLEKNLFWDAESGALTQVYLAGSSEVFSKDIRGKYFHPIAQEVTPNSLATVSLQEALWRFSEELLEERGF